jgi:hypothetical protein
VQVASSELLKNLTRNREYYEHVVSFRKLCAWFHLDMLGPSIAKAAKWIAPGTPAVNVNEYHEGGSQTDP